MYEPLIKGCLVQATKVSNVVFVHLLCTQCYFWCRKVSYVLVISKIRRSPQYPTLTQLYLIIHEVQRIILGRDV
jgi:hypothetical protein